VALNLRFLSAEAWMDPVRRSLLLDQAAELLGVSRRTIYYRIREGRLRTIRTRCGSQRVLLESLETLLREQMRLRRAAAGSGDAGVS
jgi:excisionase family DNA binding protein